MVHSGNRKVQGGSEGGSMADRDVQASVNDGRVRRGCPESSGPAWARQHWPCSAWSRGRSSEE
jgi:hypothetical protein